MIDLLHLAAERPSPKIWIAPFMEELHALGRLTVIENGNRLSEGKLADSVRACDVLLTAWGSARVPAGVAQDPGRLKYICHITGTVRSAIPVEIIDAGIPVTNWGDAPAGRVAEGALTLLLACLKGLPERAEFIRDGSWKPPAGFSSWLVEGLNVGVYGCGAIGRRFVEMLRPLGANIRVFDPYAAELPAGTGRAGSLAELFASSEAIAVHAASTPETAGAVTAELLAMLPDGGVVINTARGAIIDQEALFSELKSGRLRAGLDVLEPDELPGNHPAREWKNLILSAHDINLPRPLPRRLMGMHRVCLENLRRYLEGKPLRFLVDRARYERST